MAPHEHAGTAMDLMWAAERGDQMHDLRVQDRERGGRVRYLRNGGLMLLAVVAVIMLAAAGLSAGVLVLEWVARLVTNY